MRTKRSRLSLRFFPPITEKVPYPPMDRARKICTVCRHTFRIRSILLSWCSVETHGHTAGRPIRRRCLQCLQPTRSSRESTKPRYAIQRTHSPLCNCSPVPAKRGKSAPGRAEIGSEQRTILAKMHCKSPTIRTLAPPLAFPALSQILSYTQGVA
jgi:hypothetical protein